MFIVGLSNQAIKEQLLQEESLNLDKAIKIAKAFEITQLQARNLNKSTEVVVAKVGRSAHNSANWQKSKNSHLSNQVEGTSNSRQIIQEMVQEGNIDEDNLLILAVNQCDDESELDSEQERIANEMEEFIDFESSGSAYIPPSSSSDRMSSTDARTSFEIIQETVLEGNIGWDNSNEASTSEASLPLAPQAVVPPSTLASIFRRM
ncbi:hypothetical protein JTB14_035035 [Gonioctena quinquepunctata]|nr:hypothetical protein JTB14_035035 [Gonioctena quinquepunctata]